MIRDPASKRRLGRASLLLLLTLLTAACASRGPRPDPLPAPSPEPTASETETETDPAPPIADPIEAPVSSETESETEPEADLETEAEPEAASPSPRFAFPVADASLADQISRFGDPRSGRRTHEGVDIAAPRGTPVLAAADGVVERVGKNRLGGLVIWLVDDHGQRHYYAHLDDAEPLRRGDRVRAGQRIGRVGTSGNAAGGAPHLHFGLYEGWRAIDPEAFLRRSQALASGS